MDEGENAYKRYVKGDDEGMAELVRLYANELTLYINGFTRDMTLSEELMEDAFVKLAVKKPRFNGKSSFKTWFFAIGRNLTMDRLKRLNKRRSRETDLETAELVSGDVESVILKEENKAAVEKALQSLNEDYRRALYLSYFENRSSAEIQQAMNKNRRQVENLLSRGRKALKKQLEKEGFSYEEQ